MQALEKFSFRSSDQRGMATNSCALAPVLRLLCAVPVRNCDTDPPESVIALPFVLGIKEWDYIPIRRRRQGWRWWDAAKMLFACSALAPVA